MDGVLEAVGVLGAARADGLDADTALGLALAARHAQAAALAVEADALARLAAAYPECGLRGRDPEHATVVFELMAALGVSQRSAPTGWPSPPRWPGCPPSARPPATGPSTCPPC